MTEDTPALEAQRKTRRLWLTVGEVVAVLGLGLAALNYWDGHRERAAAERAQTQKAQAEKVSIFIMRGAADANGERVMLEPLKTEQVIQSQRYIFPKPVLDHAMEIDAGRPQIDLAWFEHGLRDRLAEARKAGAKLPEGEAELPVGVLTTYIEDGQTRADTSLYRVGYSTTSSFLGGIKFHLLGVSLVQRGVKADLHTVVDGRWRSAAPAPPAAPAKATPG